MVQSLRMMLHMRRCLAPCIAQWTPAKPVCRTLHTSAIGNSSSSSQTDTPRRNSEFPTFIPIMRDPFPTFEKFALRTKTLMRHKFALNENQLELPEDEKGFCIANEPMIISFFAAGIMRMIKRLYYERFQKPDIVKQIKQYDKNFDEKQLLQDSAKRANMISKKLAQRDYASIEADGVLSKSRLKAIQLCVDQLSEKQRKLLNFSMSDYQGSGARELPNLIEVKLVQDGDRLFAVFYILDAAMYELEKIKFEKRPPGDYPQDYVRTNAILDKAGEIFLLNMSDYQYKIPRQILVNTILTRQLAPVLSEEYLSVEFNIMVAP